ncbi:MAG TPA: polysaccharide biosynthesis/export family protein, partial [Xanthomonadales bacterium]|nr:polysaccharide biosynthesis/export family protein [Xanthomonadales bacterium]
MITRSTHSLRALAAVAALLLAAGPFAPAGAQTPATSPGSTPAATPAPAPPIPDAGTIGTVSPVIHPGDVLTITVFDEPTLPSSVVVQADGTIQYPLAGRVLVAGMSAAEARDVLTRALRKFMKHPAVTLAVQQQGQINVLVLGNVKNSGKFQMRSGAHLIDAVSAAGGVATSYGEFPLVKISEADGTVATASLEKLIRGSDATQNLPLEDNSMVYVTGAETVRVQVIGAVSRPGNVEVNVGDRLTMALARAGAEASVRPDLNRVVLTRLDPTTGKNTPFQ